MRNTDPTIGFRDAIVSRERSQLNFKATLTRNPTFSFGVVMAFRGPTVGRVVRVNRHPTFGPRDNAF